MKVKFPPETKQEVELFLVFAVCVAGKRADQTREKVNRMFVSVREPMRALHLWASDDTLMSRLKAVGMGQYKRLSKALGQIAALISEGDMDLRRVTPSDLEKIPGIGFKTSRFFLTYTRDETRYAVLDTHVLKWLARRKEGVPRSTPIDQATYEAWEAVFVEMAESHGLTPRKLDDMIWNGERLKKPLVFWDELFQDPDVIGSSEYRAIHNVCGQALEVLDVADDLVGNGAIWGDKLDLLKGVLEECRNDSAELLRVVRKFTK